jgi:hypothetical protein
VDGLLVLVLAIAILGLFDVVALMYGADTRELDRQRSDHIHR